MYSSNKNGQTALLLTLILPFAGLIYSLSHWRESWAKNTFWLTCIYLGAVQIFLPEGTVLGEGADGGRMVMRLMNWYGSNITLEQIFANYLKDQHTMDFFQPLLTYFVSRYTDNGHVLYAISAVVFGFFYSRNVWYVLERLTNKPLGYIVILVTLFFLINPITNINGLRYYTAVHIFVYALIPYLYERDRSKLWWLFVVPFVHFSFLYVVLFALVFYLLTYKIKSMGNMIINTAFIVFVVSLTINSINLSSVNTVLADYSPEAFEDRIDLYVNQDVLNSRREGSALTNWYVGASYIIKNWCYSLLLLLLNPCLKRNFKNRQFSTFYVFSLLFGAIANLMSLIPSGGRFQVVSQMFMVSLILLVVVRIPINDTFRKYVGFASLLLIIPFVVDIRKLFDFYGITAILGNFITMFFWENNVPLINFIKRII